jgi:hypothetical protein
MQKSPAKKQYRSANGRVIDMDMLRQRNELTPAVGNARVNARGDELGKGGKIVRKREDVLKDYYENNQSRVRDEVITRNQPVEAVEEKAPAKKTTSKKKEEVKEEAVVESVDDVGSASGDWVEDEEGNFVKKGE